MSSSSVVTFPLQDLPSELLLRIFKTISFRSAGRLVRTNKTFYNLLNQELYKRTKQRSWFPMGFAAATNNIATLSLCIDAGAAVDQDIVRDVGYHRWANRSFYLVGGWRALREALYRSNVETILWLLARGSNPNMTADEAADWHMEDVPLAFAYRQGFSNEDKARKARIICLALLEAGADITAVKDTVQTEILHMRDDDNYLPAEWQD